MAAELTYIDLTENNVYYAANHNQGVEDIPGVPEIALGEGQRVVGKSDRKTKLILFSNWKILLVALYTIYSIHYAL